MIVTMRSRDPVSNPGYVVYDQRRYDTSTSMIQLSYIILWLSDKILVITRALIRSWGARVAGGGYDKLIILT